MPFSNFLRSDLSQTSKLRGIEVEATVVERRKLLRCQNPHSAVKITLKDNDKNQESILVLGNPRRLDLSVLLWRTKTHCLQMTLATNPDAIRTVFTHSFGHGRLGSSLK